AANHGQKRFLGQVLGALPAFQSPAKEAVQRVAITRKQLVQRLARATLEIEHQGFIADHVLLITCNAGNSQKVPESPEILLYKRMMAGWGNVWMERRFRVTIARGADPRAGA